MEDFLKNAYGVCSTFSVSRETKPRPINEVQPGDVLNYPLNNPWFFFEGNESTL